MAVENNRDFFDSGFLSVKGDFDGRIRQTKMDRRYVYEPFNKSPLAANILGAAASGATGARNILWSGYNQFEQFILGGGQTIITPVLSTSGWNCALDLTDDEGMELTTGITTNNPTAFKIGTDGAFFARLKWTIADVSGTDENFIGFRKAEAGQAALATYTDLALIGCVSGDIKIATNLNDASAVSFTDTTQNWADGETHTCVVKVSAAGVVTFEIDGAAPTATATFTFDSGDTVIPMFRSLHDATSPGAINLVEFECGLQPASRVALV